MIPTFSNVISRRKFGLIFRLIVMNKPKEVTTSPSFQHHTDVQFNFVVSLSGLNKFLKLKKKNPGRASHVYSSQTQKC